MAHCIIAGLARFRILSCARKVEQQNVLKDETQLKNETQLACLQT
jgi:hypothetical protein